MSVFFWRKRYLRRTLSLDYRFSARDLALLALLTVVWGLNWPVMKLGVTGFPPLSFRALSMWLGLPVLWAAAALAAGAVRDPPRRLAPSSPSSRSPT